MPHVTFIYPCVGRFPRTKYVRSWQMQPLSIGILAAATPREWDRCFFDDRIEAIDFDRPTDLAAISVETYTARRAYQIAAEYRRRGVRVVMGGYHATACPQEALEHADAVCVGEGEPVWAAILRAAAEGSLAGVYTAPRSEALARVTPDRSIFAGKRYFPLALVESGRGCRFRCSFCAVAAFHQSTYRRRPIPEIVAEIAALREKVVFFVDDNIVGDPGGAKELFRALAPLGIQWISQASIDIVRDAELLDLAAASGCRGLLVGFESLERGNLSSVGKQVNLAADYAAAIAALRARGILIYGTFMFGLGRDTADTIRDAVRFARRQKLFLAAFAHLVPFPGTPLYASLAEAGRLVHERWWLSDAFRFGDAPFRPEAISTEGLVAGCHAARKSFYSLPSILERGLDRRANARTPSTVWLFWVSNLLLRREIDGKRGLPLGLRDGTP